MSLPGDHKTIPLVINDLMHSSQIQSMIPDKESAMRTYKVFRRFSDFEAFHNALQNSIFIEYLLPPLPEKHIFIKNYIEQDDSEFVT